jgi:hypothetical protein
MVFGYASLTALGGRSATLPGWRRVWGVAMDNRVAIPGYKRYLDPRSGEPPPVHVAFLDIVEDPGATVEGVLLEAPDLAALDARERNYERREVLTDAGPAWAYVGSAAGRRRFAEAEHLVVDAAYLELAGAVEAPPCPICALERMELP